MTGVITSSAAADVLTLLEKIGLILKLCSAPGLWEHSLNTFLLCRAALDLLRVPEGPARKESCWPRCATTWARRSGRKNGCLYPGTPSARRTGPR